MTPFSPAKAVLVTGGAGFIGGHLVRRLLADEALEHLVVYDNFSSGAENGLADLRGDRRLRLVRGDLREKAGLSEAMRGCDSVFHLAANPDIAKAATQPEVDFWEGTFLTQNVLEVMRITGARHIVYFSGSGVYGENPAVAFAEDHGPCRPISTYGASKLAGEALLSAYGRLFAFQSRVFRFANVVGPGQTHGVGYDFIRRLAADPARLRILGDGTQRKSYLHVDDALDAVALAGGPGEGSHDVFNVATADTLSVREIADLAIQACGLEPVRVKLEFTGGDRGWRGDVPVVRLDCAKIRARGWRNQRTSLQAMRESLAALRAELT
jgi:UDP-glucose 4-epimerase